MNIGDVALYAGLTIGLAFAGSGAAPVVKRTLYDDVTPIIKVHKVSTQRDRVESGDVIQPIVLYTMREGCQASSYYQMERADPHSDGSVAVAILSKRTVIWPSGSKRAMPDVIRVPEWVPPGRYEMRLSTTGTCKATVKGRATSPSHVISTSSDPFIVEVLGEIPPAPSFGQRHIPGATGRL